MTAHAHRDSRGFALSQALSLSTLAFALAIAPTMHAQAANTAASSAVTNSSPSFAEEARATSPFAAAITPASESFSVEPTANALPEDPGSALALDQKPLDASVPANAPGQARVAPMYQGDIPAGWTAQPMSAHNKIVLGFRDLYSPLSLLAIVSSAGYEQALNGQPNYGVDKGAFGERLGAAAIRESSQTLFTEAVFAPMLHEDPRYYMEGPEHGLVHRTLYAITRPLITRTDCGHNTVNAALLLGYGAAAGISYAYYPTINQNGKDTLFTYGGSLGGAAIGFFVSEFAPQVLQAMHLEKRD